MNLAMLFQKVSVSESFTALLTDEGLFTRVFLSMAQQVSVQREFFQADVALEGLFFIMAYLMTFLIS